MVFAIGSANEMCMGGPPPPTSGGSRGWNAGCGGRPVRSSCKQRLARSQRSPGAAQPFHAPSSLLPSFRGARAGVPRRNKNAACRATRAERTPAPKAPRERENFFFAPFSLWKIVSQQTEQQRLSVSFFGLKKSSSGVGGGGPPHAYSLVSPVEKYGFSA